MRLTITLSEARHAALKATATRLGVSIGALIDQSLEAYGVHADDRFERLLQRAKESAGMTEQEATRFALRAVRGVRDRHKPRKK